MVRQAFSSVFSHYRSLPGKAHACQVVTEPLVIPLKDTSLEEHGEQAASKMPHDVVISALMKRYS